MSNTEYEDGLWARIKELEAENANLETCHNNAKEIINGFRQWQADIRKELEYYKEMELRYNQLLEETSNEAWLNMQNRVLELTKALNRIGMLASSEHAYTSEFTTKVVGIVREALK